MTQSILHSFKVQGRRSIRLNSEQGLPPSSAGRTTVRSAVTLPVRRLLGEGAQLICLR
jgi:hypothetical protein